MGFLASKLIRFFFFFLVVVQFILSACKVYVRKVRKDLLLI